MEIPVWIPVDVQPTQVVEEIQQWLDKYSYHPYESIIQDRINARYPRFSIPKALYILILEERKVIEIQPHEETVVMDAVMCPICHEEDTAIRQTITCNHTFHHHCIQEWFRHNNTCPLCRSIIN